MIVLHEIRLNGNIVKSLYNKADELHNVESEDPKSIKYRRRLGDILYKISKKADRDRKRISRDKRHHNYSEYIEKDKIKRDLINRKDGYYEPDFDYAGDYIKDGNDDSYFVNYDLRNHMNDIYQNIAYSDRRHVLHTSAPGSKGHPLSPQKIDNPDAKISVNSPPLRSEIYYSRDYQQQLQKQASNSHSSNNTDNPAPEKTSSQNTEEKTKPQSSDQPSTKKDTTHAVEPNAKTAAQTNEEKTKPQSSDQPSTKKDTTHAVEPNAKTAAQTNGEVTKPQSSDQPSTKKDTTTGSGKKGSNQKTLPPPNTPPSNNPNKSGMFSRGVDWAKAHRKPLIAAGIIGAGIGAGYVYNRHKKKKEEEKKRLAAEAERQRLANRSPLERARDKFDSLRHR